MAATTSDRMSITTEMPGFKKLLIFFLKFMYLLKICAANRYMGDSEFTVSVEAGKEECFYQPLPSGVVLEFEYQVLDAGANLEIGHPGSLSIDMTLTSPSGKIIIQEQDRSDATHRYSTVEEGDFKLCLDNRRSMVHPKLVYLEMFIDNEDPDASTEFDPFNLGTVTLAPDTRFNSTAFDELKAKLLRIHDDLMLVLRYQEWQKAHEARHRNLAEHNFSKVNLISISVILLVMGIGFLQVFIVRSFFEDKSALNRLLKTWGR